jgi:hypothetical protein
MLRVVPRRIEPVRFSLRKIMPTANSEKNSGKRRGKPENLKPWPKGVSGNPQGRPKSAPLAHACRELLAQPVPDDSEGRTYAEAIAQTLAEKALAGDIRAAQEIADRAEGKARQSIEIEHTELRDAFDKLSREELEAYAVSGTLPEWFPKDEAVQ